MECMKHMGNYFLLISQQKIRVPNLHSSVNYDVKYGKQQILATCYGTKEMQESCYQFCVCVCVCGCGWVWGWVVPATFP